MDRVVCAVDVGTSAIRASFVTPDGRVLRQARTEREAGEGTARLDPRALWNQFCSTLRQLTDGLVGVRIISLAIAGHVGHVFVDDHGDPVGEAGGWGDDRGLRGASGDGRFWQPSDAMLATMGRPAPTGGAVPALWWLRENRPEEFSRIRCVLSPKDYLVLKLTDVPATDHTTAAYYLASDVAAGEWSSEVLEGAGLPARVFPEQREAASVAGAVSVDAAASTGLPPGLPVAAGAPDGSVGVLAVLGVGESSAIADIAGTTDLLARVVGRRDHGFDRAVTNPFIRSGTWSVGGPTGMTGGAVTRWASVLGFEHVADAERRLAGELKTMPPGAGGVLAYPCLTGGRFPRWNPRERGRIWGLDDQHTAANIVQAVQEAAAFVVREALEAMTRPGEEASVHVAGGVARSPRLLQLRADAWGREVTAVAEVDVTSKGAALIAWASAGEPTGDWPALATTTYQPRDDVRPLYDEVYGRWLEATAPAASA